MTELHPPSEDRLRALFGGRIQEGQAPGQY